MEERENFFPEAPSRRSAIDDMQPSRATARWNIKKKKVSLTVKRIFLYEKLQVSNTFLSCPTRRREVIIFHYYETKKKNERCRSLAFGIFYIFTLEFIYSLSFPPPPPETFNPDARMTLGSFKDKGLNLAVYITSRTRNAYYILTDILSAFFFATVKSLLTLRINLNRNCI